MDRRSLIIGMAATVMPTLPAWANKSIEQALTERVLSIGFSAEEVEEVFPGRWITEKYQDLANFMLTTIEAAQAKGVGFSRIEASADVCSMLVAIGRIDWKGVAEEMKRSQTFIGRFHKIPVYMRLPNG